MPDYSAINQTPAHISPGDKETVYTNPEYGVEFRAPATWALADQDTKHLVNARRNDNVCVADVGLAAWSPILSLGSYVRGLSAHFQLPENKGRRIVHTTPTRLGGMPALDIFETREEQGGQITEHLIVARNGVTLYILATDSLTESVPACEADFLFIQQHLALSK